MSDLDTIGAPALRHDAGRRAKGLDPLVRYMIFSWALGALLGALLATALLVFDPFGLRPLMHDSGMGPAAAFLLYIGFMTSFGGLVCAAAVMFPPDDDEPPRGGLRGMWRRRTGRPGWPMRAPRDTPKDFSAPRVSERPVSATRRERAPARPRPRARPVRRAPARPP